MASGPVQACQRDCVLADGKAIQACVWDCEASDAGAGNAASAKPAPLPRLIQAGLLPHKPLGALRTVRDRPAFLVNPGDTLTVSK